MYIRAADENFCSLGTSTYKFPRFSKAVYSFAEKGHEITFQHGYNQAVRMKGVRLIDFLTHKQYHNEIAKSDALLFHCGIGSVIDAGEIEKPCIFVPRAKKLLEHTDDHQLELANYLAANRGASIIFPESSLTSRFKKFKSSSRKEKIRLISSIQKELFDG